MDKTIKAAEENILTHRGWPRYGDGQLHWILGPIINLICKFPRTYFGVGTMLRT